MEARKVARAAAALAAALALAAAGCGGDDDGADGAATAAAATEAAQPAGDAAAADDAAPSPGAVEAASPEEATTCLEEAGFTVSAGNDAPEELREATGTAAMLTLVRTGDGGEAGAGAVTYFESEEQATTANQAELENQVPDSVVGRVGAAVYVYAGPDASEHGRAITGCL